MNNFIPVLAATQSCTINLPHHEPVELSSQQIAFYRDEIKALLKDRNAVLVSHYYVDAEIQNLSDETGGTVSDSLEMARFGLAHPAQTLVVSGVRFMGETAKILSPHKTVLMPNLNATCSLDEGCPVDDFRAFCAQYPDHEVVVYANTSAQVKAMADWVVTSSIAVDLIKHLDNQGKKIIWAPDQHLGRYLQTVTDAEMILWQGVCVVHDEFKARELAIVKNMYPSAKILVHPESPEAVIALADFVGSTSQLIAYARQSDAQQFFVATDNRIMHKMRQAAPNKLFEEAPTAGQSATCKSCAHCPWMAMNDLKSLYEVLLKAHQPIEVEETIRIPAEKSLQKMLNFSEQLKKSTTIHVPHLGVV